MKLWIWVNIHLRKWYLKCDSSALFSKNQMKEKSKEIKYDKLEMQKYMEEKAILIIEEKKGSFLVISRMTDIKTNMKKV